MTLLLLRLTTLVAGLVLLGAALLGAGSTSTASAAAPVVASAAASSASDSGASAAPAVADAAAAPAPGVLDVSCATCEVPAPVLLLVLLAVVAVLAVGIHRLVLRAIRPRAPAIAPRSHPVDRVLLAARRRAAAPSLSSLSVLRV